MDLQDFQAIKNIKRIKGKSKWFRACDVRGYDPHLRPAHSLLNLIHTVPANYNSVILIVPANHNSGILFLIFKNSLSFV